MLKKTLAVAALLMIAPLMAQQTTATLLGTVADPAGAAVPNAIVRAQNLATNAVREASTDSAGRYSLTFLAAGDYRVTITKEGFQAYQVNKIVLQVDQAARVNVNLKLGNVTDT